MNLLNDIYYSKEYISLYLKRNEEIFEFEYKEDNFIFYNIAIKRPITKIGNEDIGDGYFDLETAYGYGGFYLNTENQGFVKIALEKYEQYCLEEKIIAEFIRFHPYNVFPQKHPEFLNMNTYDRDVAYIDLSLSKEERWKTYSSSTRNILRKCEKALALQKSKNIESFIALYEKTMDKNNAMDFYYFSKKYYNQLLNTKNIELYEITKDSTVVSSAFFMFSDEFGHYHLSANDYEMRRYNANYFILDQIFEIAKNKGKRYFLLGGGTTSDIDDSLLKFKQKFSSLTQPFYIGGKIYNDTIYRKYKTMWEEQSRKDVKYFLKYRLEISERINFVDQHFNQCESIRLEEIILIGGGGHCKSCIDVIEQEKRYKIAGIIDKHELRGTRMQGYEIIGGDDDLPALSKKFKYAFITVGQVESSLLREKLFKLAKEAGFQMPVIVSPRAYVSKYAKVEEGTIVMHDALINADVKIGKNCIINSKALIEHDTVVNDHCHISTGAILNGGAVVKRGTFYGSNATSKEYAVIEGFIKAGSIVK